VTPRDVIFAGTTGASPLDSAGIVLAGLSTSLAIALAVAFGAFVAQIRDALSAGG